MPVLDFECQLARSQITRYMGGEALSQESLRQLGLHAATCPGCKEFLSSRREALKSMIESDASEKLQKAHEAYDQTQFSKKAKRRSESDSIENLSPVSHAVVAENTAQPSAAERLMAKIRERQPEPKLNTASAETSQTTGLQTKGRSLSKPLALCGLLAVALIGMSYVVKSPQHLFGPKAITADALSPKLSTSPDLPEPTNDQTQKVQSPSAQFIANTSVAPPQTQLTTTKAKPPIPAISKITGIKPIAQQPKETSKSIGHELKPVVRHRAYLRHATIHPTYHRVIRHRAPRHHSGGYIKIYQP